MKAQTLHETLEWLTDGKSVVLVGPTGSGKTRFSRTKLLPTLKGAGLNANMVNDCDEDFSVLKGVRVAVIDEVETFIDRDFLEKKHPEEVPYYTAGYVKQVLGWFDKLEKVGIPAVYVITRNEKEEVDYLVANMKVTDWGRKVKTLSFLGR